MIMNQAVIKRTRLSKSDTFIKGDNLYQYSLSFDDKI